MQFEKSETFKNLASSFAGECQAGMRYQLTAQAAMQQGYKTLADEIRKIAKNETVHARRFYESLTQNGISKNNITISNGFPFHSGDLVDGLKFSAISEKQEFTEIYPDYAETAKKEGFEPIASLYLMIAEVERQHHIIFDYLYNAVKDGTLYKSEKSEIWICSECGHIHVGKQALKVCPLCQMKQGYVELHLPYEGVKI